MTNANIALVAKETAILSGLVAVVYVQPSRFGWQVVANGATPVLLS